MSRDELALVASQVELFPPEYVRAGYQAYVRWQNQLISPAEVADNIYVESPFAAPSVMLRRAVFDHVGRYAAGPFPEDYELWLRWLSAGVQMSKVSRELLRWNDAPARLSRNDKRYGTDAFYRCKALYLGRWLQTNVDSSRPIIVWGAGRPTRKRAEYLLEHGIEIRAYIDIDPEKQGRSLSERPVLSPSEIPEDAFVLAYVANRGARDLIRGQLQSGGRAEGQDFLMAA